jgi:hypothetical protein
MGRMNRRRHAMLAAALAVCVADRVQAHSGPPFPILSDRIAGPYRVSIWTDPDATEDGTLGGQFWITLESAVTGDAVPAKTRARVFITALDQPTPEQSAATQPVGGDAGNQFAALLMDHEGPFAVRVEIEGPLGVGTVTSRADATYDLRPAPYMLVWYLAPFLLVAVLWTRLLLKRRTVRPIR